MSCKNSVDVVVQGRYDSKIIEFQCGNTNHHGETTLCDSCLNDPVVVAELEQRQANADADNAWLASAGWGEM